MVPDDDSADSVFLYPLSNDGSIGSGRALKRFKFWRAKNFVAKFIGSLFCLLPEAPKWFKRFDYLFDVFHRFARVGQEESLFLIRCGAVPRLVSFYQGSDVKVQIPAACLTLNGSIPEPIQRGKMREGNESQANFSTLLATLSILAASGASYNTARAYKRWGTDDLVETDDEESGIPPHLESDEGLFYRDEGEPSPKIFVLVLPARDSKLLSSDNFLKNVVETGKLGAPSLLLCTRLVWQDIELSKRRICRLPLFTISNCSKLQSGRGDQLRT